jgi:hypothetical protein
VSSEAQHFHEGFFARIIRDARSTLPDATGERQTLMLEQQLHAVVEHAETATPVIAQPNIHAQTPTHTAIQIADAIAPTPMSSPVALQDSPLPASAARKIINAEVQPSPKGDQHSATVPVSEAVAGQPVHKNATHFPRNTRAMAALQPVKKIPLAITLRDPHAAKVPQAHPLVTTVVHGKPNTTPVVRNVIAPTPAADVPAVVGSFELTKVVPTDSTLASKRPALPVAPPVIAESVPVPMHRLPERKIQAPALRIGAVTIRVVDAVPEQAASSRSIQSVTHATVDPIASAESRHFLRTL